MRPPYPFFSNNSNNTKKTYHDDHGSMSCECNHNKSRVTKTKIFHPVSMYHGIEMQSDSAFSIVGRRNNSHNLQLTQFPIELQSDHVVQEEDDNDDDDQLVVDGDSTSIVGKDDQETESDSSSILMDLSKWLISTLKRRKKKMNKHKLRKRRKLERRKENK
mmetsp:Transcript_6811/g.12818  ORF Transcript_6811/g.12818 Transcript_6811/m.12818 type:complete len:161 (-) Transcript_6811:112-594(-)